MQKARRKGGFTILEVMFAAAVMALAITSSILVMGRGFADLDTARCLSYASQIMQSEMEKIRLTPWGNGATPGTGTSGVSAYSLDAGGEPVTIDSTFTTPGDVGTRMTMRRYTEVVHTGMIRITLTITWTTYDRRSLSRSYVTYYAKNGLYDYFVI